MVANLKRVMGDGRRLWLPVTGKKASRVDARTRVTQAMLLGAACRHAAGTLYGQPSVNVSQHQSQAGWSRGTEGLTRPVDSPTGSRLVRQPSIHHLANLFRFLPFFLPGKYRRGFPYRQPYVTVCQQFPDQRWSRGTEDLTRPVDIPTGSRLVVPRSIPPQVNFFFFWFWLLERFAILPW